MDILNWVYLLKNRLIKTAVINPEEDLVILGSNVSYAKRGDKYQSYGITVQDFRDSLLNGTDYIIVQANGTPEENAQEFIAAYAEAVAADKDAEHRFTLVLAPGHYKFLETFLHEESFIDIVSLTGEQDVIFDLELNGRDPFLASTPAYMYDLNINAGPFGTYTDTLQNGIPGFLQLDGTILEPGSRGFDPTGMYFAGNATGYPIVNNFAIPQATTTTITFKFIQSESCSDQGVCVYLDGGTPNWQFGPDATRIAIQYSCAQPWVYGTTIFAGGAITLTIGETYIAEFTYNPTLGTSTLVTKDLAGVILNTTSINQVLGAGNYRIGFSADSDDADPSTSSVMDIDTRYTKVSGIKTQEYTSDNYVNWALSNYGNNESNFYPLPLNVILSNHTELEVKNCTAGPFSFGSDINFNGNDITATITDCTALGYSFGFGAFQIESDSVFTNCSAGNNSFYIDDDLRGIYTNCTAGNNSFYSIGDDIEATFVNCTAGDFSFYTDGDDFTNNASFTNCTAGTDSFYAFSQITGTTIFTNCTAGDDSFWAQNSDNDGKYTNCTAGVDSFRAGNCNDGTYINCIGNTDSFFSDVTCYNMTNFYCLLFNSTFVGGTQYYCQDTL
jgi:hypothetical protein